jgi:hypothetical protein
LGKERVLAQRPEIFGHAGLGGTKKCTPLICHVKVSENDPQTFEALKVGFPGNKNFQIRIVEKGPDDFRTRGRPQKSGFHLLQARLFGAISGGDPTPRGMRQMHESADAVFYRRVSEQPFACAENGEQDCIVKWQPEIVVRRLTGAGIDRKEEIPE